jgi:hypothetical protein
VAVARVERTHGRALIEEFLKNAAHNCTLLNYQDRSH